MSLLINLDPIRRVLALDFTHARRYIPPIVVDKRSQIAVQLCIISECDGGQEYWGINCLNTNLVLKKSGLHQKQPFTGELCGAMLFKNSDSAVTFMTDHFQHYVINA